MQGMVPCKSCLVNHKCLPVAACMLSQETSTVTQTCQVSLNFRESLEIVHDLQVSREVLQNLTEFDGSSIFLHKKHAFGVNPRNADHKDLVTPQCDDCVVTAFA